MSWEKVKLGDIANCIQPGPFGSQLHSSDYADEGTPIIMPKDMIGGKISRQDLIRVPDEHLQRLKRHQVFDGDLMVARKGDVRKCVYITENENGWLTGSDCLKVSLDKSRCCPKYIYYQLRSPFIGRWLETISIGATMPSLNTGLLSGIEISLPTISEQMRIAEVLSTYDDLIENNQKQIKLLEEAAQRLYKEWFVDLRFPGYETTAIADGIPEGWNATNINAVMTFHRGYDLTKSNMVSGKYPVVGSTSIIGYHNQYKISGPGIVTGRSGSLGEYQLIWEDFWPHNTSLYVSDMKGHHVLYLYGMLQTVDFSSLNNGGAIPTLNRNTLSNIAVLEAPQALQQEYVRIAEPHYQAMRKATQQILYLQEARDRLLPKLMSGEIEV